MTKANISYDIVNLGEQNKNLTEKSIGVFYLKNCGNNNLFIYHVDRDCSCTDYVVSDTLIVPKDSVKIQVIYDNRHDGYFTHSVKIHCNTEDSPYILTIIGTLLTRSDL
jgi:hypothetical protein